MRGRERLIFSYNFILLAVLCLFLTACGSDVGALEPTNPLNVTTAGAADTDQAAPTKGTDQKTESQTEAFHPLTYQVDLSHDEVPEMLTINAVSDEDTIRMELSVTQNESVLWTSDLDLADGLTRKAYFLCSVGGEDFLAAYRAYLAEGSYRYIFEVFDLEENKVHYVDMEQIRFGVNAVEGYPLDAVEIGRKANLMIWYLERGILLCSNENETYTYSTQDAQHPYVETFAEAFSPAEDYSDCATVQEKAERYNALHDETEGTQVPEIVEPDEFDLTAKELVQELRAELWLGEELSETAWFWFRDYLNWEVQVLRSAEQVDTPTATKDAVYYFPKGNTEMQVEQIAAQMLMTLFAEMTVEKTNRDFAVTGYWIPEQKLMTLETGLAECLEDWIKETGASGDISTDIRDWLLCRSQEEGFLPVADNMWYFIPEGYYAYEGTVGGLTMEEAMEASPETVVGDMVPLIPEGSEEKPVFVLMKYGNVYRLQSVDGMQIMHDELVAEAELEESLQDKDE